MKAPRGQPLVCVFCLINYLSREEHQHFLLFVQSRGVSSRHLPTRTKVCQLRKKQVLYGLLAAEISAFIYCLPTPQLYTQQRVYGRTELRDWWKCDQEVGGAWFATRLILKVHFQKLLTNSKTLIICLAYFGWISRKMKLATIECPDSEDFLHSWCFPTTVPASNNLRHCYTCITVKRNPLPSTQLCLTFLNFYEC